MSIPTKKIIFLLLIPITAVDECGTGNQEGGRENKPPRLARLRKQVSKSRCEDKPKSNLKKQKDSIKKRPTSSYEEPAEFVTTPPTSSESGTSEDEQVEVSIYENDMPNNDIDSEDEDMNNNEYTKVRKKGGSSMWNKFKKLFKKKEH